MVGTNAYANTWKVNGDTTKPSNNNFVGNSYSNRNILGPLFTMKARYFFMNTDNVDSKNFYANGLNLSFEYHARNLFRLFGDKHTNRDLSVWAGYSHVSNLGSSDLLKDTRYEIGLFDIKNPTTQQFGAVTTLSVVGKISNFDFTLGRFKPNNNPFINAQDGRLRPTYIQGANVSYEFKFAPLHIEFTSNLTVANQILVRSSNAWSSINQSIGLYPSGVNTNGKLSTYLGAINSNNLLILPSLGFTQSKEKDLGLLRTFQDSFYLLRKTEQSAHYHLVYLNSLFTTQMVEFEGAIQSLRNHSKLIGLDAEVKSKNRSSFSYGFMWIHQGSNTQNSDTSYMVKNAISNVFSGKLEFLKKKGLWVYMITLAGTRITKEGRYLMPREWGRDPFYTFMPRERNEGYGDLTAWTINTTINRDFTHLGYRKIYINKVYLGAGYGHYQLPDVKNFTMNKYGMPSYNQVNIVPSMEIATGNRSVLFNFQFWYIQKFKNGNTYDQLKYELNKVDMKQINILFNFAYVIK